MSSFNNGLFIRTTDVVSNLNRKALILIAFVKENWWWQAVAGHRISSSI